MINSFIKKKKNFNRKPIFIWSVQREKGLNETINTWINQFFPKYKKAQFHVFGIKKFSKKYTKKYLSSKNIFFKGRVSKDQLRKNYEKALAMVCLGFDETFCLNALEANACGLPIITFGKTALKNYVKHNYNGVIVNDYNELPFAMSKMMSQKKSLKIKLINNSIIKSKNYHIENIMKYWLKLI